MIVAAQQEQEKNEKMGKRDAGKERKQSNDFDEAALLRSFRGQHGEKMVRVRGAPGVTGTLGRANNHFGPTKTGSGTAPPR